MARLQRAQRPYDARDERGLDLSLGHPAGTQLAAGGMDEGQEHREVPGDGDVGAEHAGVKSRLSRARGSFRKEWSP